MVSVTPSSDRQLSLKGAGLVLVANDIGEIPGPSREGLGLYAWDTRHLSTYRLHPSSGRLRVTHVTLLPDGARIEYAIERNGTVLPLLMERRVRVEASLTDRWTVRNLAPRASAFRAELHVAADFRDLLEVRRLRRITSGRLEPARLNADGPTLRYRAGDGVRHETTVRAAPAVWRLAGTSARGDWGVRLGAGESARLDVSVRVHSSAHPRPVAAGRRWPAWHESATRFASDSPSLDRWLEQSSLDLFVLCDQLEDGLFPMAGSPWYLAPFGRDSLITAMSALTLRPDMALGVLRSLARWQGRADDARRDEEPGRIPHEVRQGELVRTGGAFASPYYGSVDATPLFVWLAAEAERWLPDAGVIETLEPQLRSALRWMDEWGDRDGDGFIEYRRRAPPGKGIDNQVWKDSHDSLLTPDGHAPAGPIAAVEVQAYAYAARIALAEVVAGRDPAWARQLAEGAAALRRNFERAFWLADRQFYAQAIDGAKRPIPDVTSNAGHVLWTGIASTAHGRRVTARLRRPDMASGWGIRTRSSRSRHYDEVSYHNGSVWPHDTAIAAAGMGRYGARGAAAATIGELLAAAETFPDHRLPELYGGDRRTGNRPPRRYPVACSPQAWTAAAAFMCVRTMLGLQVSPDGRRVTFDPLLPGGVRRFEAVGLRVGRGSIDVRIERRAGRARISAASASGIELGSNP